MARLVSRVLDESGFEAAVVCEFLGDRKLANTRKIVRLARDFDRQGGFTLADFVARLRADLENEPREEQAATTDEAGASIRLMSIHQAKGLEFPIVVAARPGAGLAPAEPAGRLPSRPRPGRPPAAGDAGVDRRLRGRGRRGGAIPSGAAYLTLERTDDEQESLRLFYVAATRARDALILSAGLGPDEPVKSTSIAMRLLDERFDRRTGECRVEPARPILGPLPGCPRPPDDSAPAPRAIGRRTPPLRRRHASRLSITAIERVDRRAARPASATSRSRPSGRPRYLDLDPATGYRPARRGSMGWFARSCATRAGDGPIRRRSSRSPCRPRRDRCRRPARR